MKALCEKLDLLLRCSDPTADHIEIVKPEAREMLAQLRAWVEATAAKPSDALLSARVGKANDSRDVKPADLCRVLAHDIDTGAVKADSVVLVFMDRPEHADWDVGRYVANMSCDQELVALELAKEQCIRRWVRR